MYNTGTHPDLDYGISELIQVTSPPVSPGHAQPPRTSWSPHIGTRGFAVNSGQSFAISPHMCYLPGFRRDFFLDDFGTTSQDASYRSFIGEFILHMCGYYGRMTCKRSSTLSHSYFLPLYLCSLLPEVARIMLRPIPNPILCYT